MKFQNNIIQVNHDESEVFKLSSNFEFNQYKDFSSFLTFLNSNSEFLAIPNTTGLIMHVDDQFFNQQSMLLNLTEINLNHRFEIFQNGGDILARVD